METCNTCDLIFQKHANSGPKFFKLLDEDSSHYLRISKENLGNAKESFKNMKSIIVKGPNGVYEIGINISREAVTLEKGWAEFYRAHNLCKTDKLKFSCGLHGLFQIHIYDKNGELVGPSVTKRGGVKPKNEGKNKGKADASSSRFPGKEKDRVNIENTESDTSDSSENEEIECRVVEIKAKKAFISRRRAVTDAEKEMALETAKGFRPSRPYFLREMIRTNVYREFSFVVPVEFARANLPAEKTDIFLRVPGRIEKWKINCLFRVQNLNQTVWHFSGGWWKFSFDNNLEEGDVCVFELTSGPEKKQKKKMKVHIFRVLEEIAPLHVV